MEALLSGVPASRLFKTLRDGDPSIDGRELGVILMDEFRNISPAASISIRKWANRINEVDFPDEQIDGLISFYLKAAGYVP